MGCEGRNSPVLPVGVARRLGEFSCGEYLAYFPSRFPLSDLLFE